MCAIVAAVGLAGVAGFQIVLALGAPLGHAAWGGRHAELSSGLRTGSAVSAVVLLAAAAIVLGRAGIVAGPEPLFRRGTWVVAVMLAVSALGNVASSSHWEQFLQGPLALVIAACCFLVARSPELARPV